MTKAVLKSEIPEIIIQRADLSAPIFAVTGRAGLSIRKGTIVTIGDATKVFEAATPVRFDDPVAGRDYAVLIDADGDPVAVPAGDETVGSGVYFGGFHFAPFGNAQALAGGESQPAINPFSCWDAGFRPACPDPRGMTLVEVPSGNDHAGKRFWADIYLLAQDHHAGTSRFGATIANGGRDLPVRVDGNGRYERLDYATAKEIFAHHGKQLLGAEEFFAAAYGVKERSSRDGRPGKAGEADGLPFVSHRGIIDATGTMWQWGTDGDPDNPRASIFGGSWWDGAGAGSRYAGLDFWPEDSSESLSARGRSDHLSPA